MRCTTVHILGVGAALGALIPIDQLSSHARHRHQRSVSIASGTAGVDLAIRAGLGALHSASIVTPGQLPVPTVHLHSAIWRGSRGLDFWSRAAYIRSRLGLPAGPGITGELNAMSNSMVGGIELSARILAGSQDINTLMLTGGEVFGGPAFPHLDADDGIPYGDGGSAVLIGRERGLARILSTSSWTDPTLEALHRGTSRFIPPGSTEVGVEAVSARKRQYLDTTSTDSVHRRNRAGITHVMTTALADAGVTADDVAWFLLPHYGHQILDTQCLTPLGIDESRTLRYAGDQWGHMGPNDQIVGLTHLIATQSVSPGDHIALIGIGIGMTWTAAIARINQVPPAMSRFAPPLIQPWHRTSGTTVRSAQEVS